MNSFGTVFRVQLFGESHGPRVGAVLDGVPPGIPIDPADFEADLERRRSGALGTTARHETDAVEILSGVSGGFSSGAPMCLSFANGDVRSADYDTLARSWRPGHADFVAHRKYGGFADLVGGGHFSGRLTLPLVAAGVVAKKALGAVVFRTRMTAIGGRSVESMAEVDSAVEEAAATGDSVGAIVEVIVEGLDVGWGEPFFDGVEQLVAHAAFAVPGVRGIEFGDGFGAASMRGSTHNDPFIDDRGNTSKNGAGGINGGISNGNPLIIRAAFKPTSTISRPQSTFDRLDGAMREASFGGRHDACIAIRGQVALEAAVAIALADLRARGFALAPIGKGGQAT
jgi:chorismate synthase